MRRRALEAVGQRDVIRLDRDIVVARRQRDIAQRIEAALNAVDRRRDFAEVRSAGVRFRSALEREERFGAARRRERKFGVDPQRVRDVVEAV